MAGLFTAERPRFLLEFDQNVAVTDVGLDDRDARVSHRAMQSEVAHRSDDESAAEGVSFEEVAREQDHEVITVANLPPRVNRDQTIGVPVKGETEIGVQFEHVGDEVIDMRRAALLVDVATAV